ncbi:hypothetical protein [Flavobacterium sp.]|uniref:hypothetical protein n=1 Tax=Flavobacterium sp. TaxID=239 RepID=UPI0026383E33|nr:hypothetical protein [Flavobacterium sp.]
MRNYFYYIALIALFGCSTQKQLSDDFYNEDKNVNLFAFVGKKIAVVSFDAEAEQLGEKVYDAKTGDTIIQKSIIMDSGSRCKYVIIKNVFNNPKIDTIDFVAYDHYGIPNFSKYETVLLYVSKSSKGNIFFHQKYQFDYLEKNNDGQFYGYTYDKIERKKRIIFTNKRKASLEDLFKKRKTEVFKSLFEDKSGS